MSRKTWKTVGEPEDLGHLIGAYEAACTDVLRDGGTEDLERRDKLMERLEHHPDITEDDQMLLKLHAPTKRDDPGFTLDSKNAIAEIGIQKGATPRRKFGTGRNGKPGQLDYRDTWNDDQESFDRQKAARAALPEVVAVALPSDLHADLGYSLGNEYPSGVSKAQIEERGDELREMKRRSDLSSLEALSRYASGGMTVSASQDPQPLVLRKRDLNVLRRQVGDLDKQEESGDEQILALEDSDLEHYRELIPHSRASAREVSSYLKDPDTYHRYEGPVHPEIAQFEALATGDMSVLKKSIAENETAGNDVDYSGLTTSAGTAQTERDAAGLRRSDVESDLDNYLLKKRGRMPDMPLVSNEDTPRTLEDMATELEVVFNNEATYNELLQDMSDRERLAQENTVSKPTARYNEIADEMRKNPDLDDARVHINGAFLSAATGDLAGAQRKLAEAQEVGFGDYQANRSHIFREMEQGWESRPRGSKGKWTPVGDLPPSADLIAPSAAADALGGRCLRCGKVLTDTTRNGGYGPECVKKV